MQESAKTIQILNNALVFVAQSVRRWVETQPLISSAGLIPFDSFFLHLTTRLGWLFFFFSFYLLIIVSSKSKSDSPSQEN